MTQYGYRIGNMANDVICTVLNKPGPYMYRSYWVIQYCIGVLLILLATLDITVRMPDLINWHEYHFLRYVCGVDMIDA